MVAEGKESLNATANRAILIGLMMPLLMIILNMSMFQVAAPTIRDSFVIRTDVTAWLFTAYALPVMIFMPMYGRLGDGLGKRRVFLAGIALFLIGTIINLLATDLRFLFLGRIIQGIGGAAPQPLGIAMISERFPEEQRGKALGTWNSIASFASMSGPFLGGYLILYFGWRSIFIASLLVGLGALVVIWQKIPSLRQSGIDWGFLGKFDWGGVVLLAATLTVIVFYASSLPITGVAPLRDWRLLVASIGVLTGFLAWEKRQNIPLIALDIFANKNFSRALVGSALRKFTMAGMSFLVPLYLVDVRAMNAATIGMMLTIHSAASLLTTRLGGQFADRWGSRFPVILGMSFQVGAITALASLPATVPQGWVIVALICHGLGGGLSLAPFHRASLNKISQERLGQAAGLYTMVSASGNAYGAALVGVVLQFGLDQSGLPIQAYHLGFGFVAGIATLGILVNLRLKG
ncbi:MAG: MFS transporter [Chloroflexota bacterium]